jgi:hypothetical protein
MNGMIHVRGKASLGFESISIGRRPSIEAAERSLAESGTVSAAETAARRRPCTDRPCTDHGRRRSLADGGLRSRGAPTRSKSRGRRLLISSSNDLMPSIGIVQTRYDAAEHRRLATCDMERWRFIPDRDQA